MTANHLNPLSLSLFAKPSIIIMYLNKDHFYVFIIISLLLDKVHHTSAFTTLREKCESLSTDYKIYVYGSCFVMNHTHQGDWHTWPDKCDLFPKGRLAAESNSAIRAIFQDFMTQNGEDDIWIGGYKTDVANEILKWVMNRAGEKKPMDQATFYHSSQPNQGNVENCLLHGQSNQLWYDAPCSWNLPFACQYDDTAFQYKMAQTGKKGSSNTEIGTFITTELEVCAIRCRLDPFCYSFSFKEFDGECILHWDIAMSTDNPPETNSDYTLYTKD